MSPEVLPAFAAFINQLNRYSRACTDAHGTEQKAICSRFLDFVQREPRCFERECPEGHITGSAWIESFDGTQVLLTHHRKLQKWLQLGGHCDGQTDVLAVALREAEEESGYGNIVPVTSEIFDLDIHWIPERKNEPGHYHYDVRYWLRVQEQGMFKVSEESLDLAWISPTNWNSSNTDASVQRLFERWLQLREKSIP